MDRSIIKHILKHELRYQQSYLAFAGIGTIFGVLFSVLSIFSGTSVIYGLIFTNISFSILLFHSAKVDILEKLLEIETTREDTKK